MSFLEIQTRTGWGKILEAFAEWCQPQPGWITLDVGCGPGLLPALFAQYGCRAYGIDLDEKMLAPGRLHANLVQADAFKLPFPDEAFDLVTASNLLFLLPDPNPVLREIRRVVAAKGQIAMINPSEHMSVPAAIEVADQHNLQGAGRDSLINWAARAEANQRWDRSDVEALLDSAEFQLVDTTLKMRPGLARLAKGKPR